MIPARRRDPWRRDVASVPTGRLGADSRRSAAVGDGRTAPVLRCPAAQHHHPHRRRRSAKGRADSVRRNHGTSVPRLETDCAGRSAALTVTYQTEVRSGPPVSGPVMEERSRVEERWSEYLKSLYQERESLESTPHTLAFKLIEQGR